MKEKYNEPFSGHLGLDSSRTRDSARNDLNFRQRKFVDAVLRGVPHGTAYEEAGYKASADVADTCAARLLRNARVSEAIKEARERMEAVSMMDREEMVSYLISIMMTPIGELTAESPLVQEVWMSRNGETCGIKMVSKIEAAKLLCRIMGWNNPEPQMEPVSTKVSEIIRLVRGRRALTPD